MPAGEGVSGFCVCGFKVLMTYHKLVAMYSGIKGLNLQFQGINNRGIRVLGLIKDFFDVIELERGK